MQYIMLINKKLSIKVHVYDVDQKNVCSVILKKKSVIRFEQFTQKYI
jgi:hypothetical protein